ncbi:peptidoglycan/LPS O-acetylase OafA/YrhL [Saccharothrix tamanrassetensis]|uniref:Peptidoglycan/LPS O-acetylase OafA/YrhL n=1 Tax=Saccharothrix tamanrassetensis TaxID=1051531 RepID=A0A841CNJ2_9PSEU|nr:acyltransferase family protein [Saccharothrix tamanrassetensis]MBB5957934.1 peptidoglycan/LPS O-acetylase OafA/YrhL [Saccharothrix tamanrassetensis]
MAEPILTLARSSREDTTTGATPAASPTGPAPRFRPEIQGLRAVAVTLVVVYHVWLGRVSGGVDVFFVISGFLVTGQLVRATAKGRIAFVPLWGRMVKRLFPAALTVLLVVMAVSVVALPGSRWFQTIREIVAAALYLENWQLAADSADYFAQHNSASVVQHFWSLSIQGQFFVVWPLMAALALFLARVTGWGARRIVHWLLVAVFVESLVFSIALTSVDQPLAYFHSLTRAWEFALGGLLALVVDTVVLPRAARVVLGWAGIAGLVACGLVLQVGTVFPGWLALWPTLCGAAVIVAGTTGSGAGADRLLGTPFMRYVGDLSYSLYLWHWPVLVLFLVARGQRELGLVDGAFVIALSVLLSVATYHLVEKPVRGSAIGVAKPWGAYRFGVLLLVPVLVGAGVWQYTSTRKASSYAIKLDDPDHPGALARTPGFEYWGSPDAEYVPPLVALNDDVGKPPDRECLLDQSDEELRVCTLAGPAQPKKRVVLVGDSHMHQYLPALAVVAERRQWEVTTILRGGCPFSVDSDAIADFQPCVQWNAWALERIRELRPDAVIANGTRDIRPGLTEYTPSGFVRQWRNLEPDGIRVIAVRDNPRFEVRPSECMVANSMSVARCSPARSDLYHAKPPYEDIADLPSNVSFSDFTGYFCDDDKCPPVIGNVWVYRDDNHISGSFMISMAPMVEQDFVAKLGE